MSKNITWSRALALYVKALKSGNKLRCKLAEEELRVMATVADKYIQLKKIK